MESKEIFAGKCMAYKLHVQLLHPMLTSLTDNHGGLLLNRTACFVTVTHSAVPLF